MFGGNDPSSDLAWVNKNIRFNHGPLCDIYPHEGMGCTGVCEGDSPAFLYLVSSNRGINDPEDPTQPSWGGQYVRKENTNHYVDGSGKTSISRWRENYQKEFKERADWCIKPKSVVNMTKPRVINTTDLGADPEDNSLIYNWSFYDEPSSYAGTVTIQNNSSPKAKLEIPKDAGDKTIHIILEIHDNGTPNLYAYRRVIVDLQPLSNE